MEKVSNGFEIPGLFVILNVSITKNVRLLR